MTIFQRKVAPNFTLNLRNLSAVDVFKTVFPSKCSPVFTFLQIPKSQWRFFSLNIEILRPVPLSWFEILTFCHGRWLLYEMHLAFKYLRINI